MIENENQVKNTYFLVFLGPGTKTNLGGNI
jgi:hypothetical protein